MKYILLLTILFSNLLNAQINYSNPIIVRYSFEHVLDTLEPNRRTTYDDVLTISSEVTTYANYQRLVFDSITQKTLFEGTLPTFIEQQKLKTANLKKGIPDRWHFNIKKNICQQEVYWIGDIFLINHPMPNFNWQLQDSSKTINGLLCQQATGYWKGREYTAWYTNSIPTSAGPWKANGLPGLIVELYDSKKQVYWLIKSVSNQVDKFPIGPNSRASIITREKFQQLSNATKNDMAGFLKNAGNVFSAQSGATISFSMASPNGTANISTPKPISNNPIELEN